MDAKSASLCVKSAIQKGFIELKGEDPKELEQILCREKNDMCGHMMEATLGDLLKQPDYAGLDYEDGCQEATVCCVEECDEGRSYVTCKSRIQLGNYA